MVPRAPAALLLALALAPAAALAAPWSPTVLRPPVMEHGAQEVVVGTFDGLGEVFAGWVVEGVDRLPASGAEGVLARVAPEDLSDGEGAAESLTALRAVSPRAVLIVGRAAEPDVTTDREIEYESGGGGAGADGVATARLVVSQVCVERVVSLTVELAAISASTGSVFTETIEKESRQEVCNEPQPRSADTLPPVADQLFLLRRELAQDIAAQVGPTPTSLALTLDGGRRTKPLVRLAAEDAPLDELVAEALAIAAAHPEHPPALYDAAVVLAVAGRLEEADRSLQSAIDLGRRPHHDAFLNTLAELLAWQDQLTALGVTR